MRVVVQGVETCGIVRDIADEFVRRGDSVTTIADPNPYYATKYDYGLSNYAITYFESRNRILARLLGFLHRKSHHIYKRIDWRMRSKLCCRAELYLQVWSGGYAEERILKNLKRAGVKIGTLFMGTEVRHYPCFKQQFMPRSWEIPSQYVASIEQKLRLLRRHECLSDAIFSVPDQMGLAKRPYHHLQIPIDYSKIHFQFNGRECPLIVHAPTNRAIKGSDYIETALSELKAEGVAFDYLPLQGIPHESLIRILEVADILVDELILHGPGWLGFEAMAAGTVVATRYYRDSPDCFRPPVFAIEQTNIKERLRTLIASKETLRQLAHEGRDYVERCNGIQSVVDGMVDRIFGRRSPDYIPVFEYAAEGEEERRFLQSYAEGFGLHGAESF